MGSNQEKCWQDKAAEWLQTWIDGCELNLKEHPNWTPLCHGIGGTPERIEAARMFAARLKFEAHSRFI